MIRTTKRLGLTGATAAVSVRPPMHSLNTRFSRSATSQLVLLNNRRIVVIIYQVYHTTHILGREKKDRYVPGTYILRICVISTRPLIVREAKPFV